MALGYSGSLRCHRGWVTSLTTPTANDVSSKLISASRDNTLISWKTNPNRTSIECDYFIPDRRLEGHSGFVSDVAISNNGDYAVSSSWDRSLRLWNLKTGETMHKFLGHKKDVLSVAFSPDNRQIVSGARDNKIKVWNVKGDCMHTLEQGGHTDWVSCVRFSPAPNPALIVSGSWDNTVKVWSLSEMKCAHTLQGHTGHINSVTISPDGSLCASASRDGKARLWDLTRGEHLYELPGDEPINQICFSPNRYWICTATDTKIRIYDLERKDPVADLTPEKSEDSKAAPHCTSIVWSADGTVLYSGYTDNTIRIWTVRD